MLKINAIYAKAINESISDELSSLTTKKVEDLVNSDSSEEGHSKVYFSKFVGMEADGAKYVIVTFDTNEKEYLVNYMWAIDKEGRGVICKEYTAIPEETFEKVHDAITYAKGKGVKESDIFGNPDKNSNGDVVPDIKEDTAKQISTDDIGKNYSDWLNYVLKQKDIDIQTVKANPKKIPYALIVIIKALGYIPDQALIEKFLKDTPELYEVIVNYIKKTLDSDKGIDWAMSLEHTLKNDYKVKTSIIDDDDEVKEETLKGSSLKDVFELDSKKRLEPTTQEILHRKLANLVDGEYENLEGMSADDFYDYARDNFADLDRATSDDVWNTYLKIESKDIKEDEFDDLDAAIKQDIEAQRKKVSESVDQQELFDALSKLIDAEYDTIEDFPNHEKLYDYAITMFPNIEPETVEKVWNIYFLKG